MDFRNQLGSNRDLGKLVLTRQHLGETGFQLVKELLQIQSQMVWTIRLQVRAAAMVELARPTDVAVAEMVQGHRGLDQPLEELAVRTLIVGPELFPHLVTFVKVAGIKVL